MNDKPIIPPSGMGDDSLRNYLVEEFIEDYEHGHMSRRDALKRIAGILGSFAIANTILAACAPPPAPAPTAAPPTAAPAAPTSAPAATTAPAATSAPTAVATAVSASVNVLENDPAIETMAVSFPGQGATILGYLAKPKGNGPFIGVLVCHENRGLVDHIKDVTRRFGKAGYVAIGVDLLSRQGGTDKVAADQVPAAFGNMQPMQMVEDFRAGLNYLQTLPYFRKGKIGMTGFCFGGGVVWRAATQIPEIGAAVPFYGANPPIEDVPKIQGAVLAMYGELDTRINAGIPAIEEAMKKNNKIFDKMIYPGANHAFHNDTGASYNAAAARDAWSKMLALFDKYLKA